MDVTKLRHLLEQLEWADVEFKAARKQYPKEALSSVSAFANTAGGYLIFGVDERQSDRLVGVDKVDKVQNEFIGILKDTGKFSSTIGFDVDLVTLDGKHLLVFYIHEAPRHEKPIYLNGDMKQTYLRKGGRDDKATDAELKRILRDNDLRSPDERLLDLDADSCFDERTIKWYRQIYNRHHGDKYIDLYDQEFLDQIGLLRVKDGELHPTLAAVLMFGSEKALNQVLPRPTLDAFWLHRTMDQQDTQRWDDRRTCDYNLFETWKALSDRFMYYAEQPFQIDESNLQRSHETPDYIGFREAAVNALVHQDYTDTQRTATIRFYKDASVYFNPGDSLLEDEQLGKGGSAARNPLIMQTFHRIKLSDRAGSGLKDVYLNWQRLDRPQPEINNDKARKTFQITLGKKAIVTLLQETIKLRIGVSLSAQQALVFSLCLQSAQPVDALSESSGLSREEVFMAIDYLNRQGLTQTLPEGYQAQAHFAEHLTDLLGAAETPPEKVTNLNQESGQPQPEKVTNLQPSASEVDIALAGLKGKQKTLILEMGSDGLSMKQLVETLGVKHRSHFKGHQLNPLIKKAMVAETHPDNPNHQDQAYYLTPLGMAVRQRLEDQG